MSFQSKMKISFFLWLLPFCSFILGYIAVQWFCSIAVVTVPSIVGKQIHEILPLISRLKLNLRLLDQKEEIDLPAGIILNQAPSAGKVIRSHQPLFVVVSKKAEHIKAPHCIGLEAQELLTKCKSLGISVRMYTFIHNYPNGICFAQYPCADEILEKNRLILYISCGNNKPVIWPNFIGASFDTVSYFLENHGIVPLVVNDSFTQDTSFVVDQRPFAGTLLTLDNKKPLSVQLRVR